MERKVRFHHKHFSADIYSRFTDKVNQIKEVHERQRPKNIIKKEKPHSPHYSLKAINISL